MSSGGVLGQSVAEIEYHMYNLSDSAELKFKSYLRFFQDLGISNVNQTSHGQSSQGNKPSSIIERLDQFRPARPSQSAVLPKKNAVRRFFLAQEVIKSELSVAILLATYICPVDLYLILF